MIDLETLRSTITQNVKSALLEDIGDGDITAQLIPVGTQAIATVITREDMVLCGSQWVESVLEQVDIDVTISWEKSEGAHVEAGETLFTLQGEARSILSAERCALNFLQTLSGTATNANKYASAIAQTKVKVLDTRKTIPGLRLAQKYAVTVGGCMNHRIGLYDAFLIKENHIMSCGGIKNAVEQAHQIAPGKKVEVEVESIAELELALDAGADIIMLDNFTLNDMRKAVSLTNGSAKLEASGNVNLETIKDIAQTGVDYISVGALTKDVKSIDLSMRFSIEH